VGVCGVAAPRLCAVLPGLVHGGDQCLEVTDADMCVCVYTCTCHYYIEGCSGVMFEALVHHDICTFVRFVSISSLLHTALHTHTHTHAHIHTYTQQY
jgi:hypothetical protein